MAKGQLSIEALLMLAAFLAFIAVLISAEKSVLADSKAAASTISAQSKADASALELNVLAGDGGPLTSFKFLIGQDCTFTCGAYSYCCTEGGAVGTGRITKSTNAWDKYGFYESLPV